MIGAARTLALLLSVRVRRLKNALFFGARPPRTRNARPDLVRAALRVGISAAVLTLTVWPICWGLGEIATKQKDAAIVQQLEVEPGSEGPLDVIRPVRQRWVPEPPARGSTLPESSLRTQHLMLLMLIALLAFTELAGTRVERAPPDLELLAALPLAPATIFTLRVIDESLLSLMGFLQVTPGLAALAWVAGHRFGAVPLAFALTPFLVLPLVQLRTLAEVELRTRLDARRLRNMRALLMLVTCVGGLALVAGAVAGSGGQMGSLLEGLRDHAAALMWLPPGLVVRVLSAPSRGAALWWVVALAAQALAALALGAWVIRARTAAGVDPFTVREAGRDRAPTAAPRRARAWLTPMQGKLLTHLARDWSYLSQALLVPGTIALFELALFASLASALKVELSANTIAAAGLGTGAWVLNAGLLHTMIEERGTLWLLAALPQRLERAVAQVAAAWGALAAVPAASLTALALVLRRPPPGEALVLVASVTIGLALLVVIGGACALLDGTEQADLPQARASPRYQVLFMNVALPLAGAVWVGSWWYMQAVLLLDAALAFALVDRLRERAPYFLDAHSEPARGITLLDGLIGVHVYFQTQVVGALILIRAFFVDPLTAFCASSAVGGIITLVLARGVIRLRGLDARERLTPWSGARGAAADGWLGLKAGLAAGAAALAALGVAVEYNLGDAAAQLSSVAPASRAATLAMALLIAPPVEEFLFRGLLFSGLRRSVGPRATILCTAVLFAMLHPAVSAVPVLILGLVTGWTRERTGALCAGALAHATFNAVMLSGQL